MADHLVADSGTSGVTSHLLEATPGEHTRHLVAGHLAVDGGTSG